MAFELAKAYVSVQVQTGKLRQGLDRAVGMVRRSVMSMKTLFAAGISGIGLGLATKWAIGIASAAEQSRIAFNVILKDMAKTRDLLAQLDKFSVTTPFEPAAVRAAGQTLVQAGVAAEDVTGILQMLGDMAAGAGGDLNELVRGFVKLKGEGRLMAELEDTFMTQGILLRDLVVKYSDLQGSYRDLRSSGKLTFEEMMKVFRRATAEGGLFFEATKQQSESAAGLWSTLTGNFAQAGEIIGTALLPAVKQLSKTLIDLLDTAKPDIQNWADSLANAMVPFIENLKTLSTWIRTQWPTLMELMKETARDAGAALRSELSPLTPTIPLMQRRNIERLGREFDIEVEEIEHMKKRRQRHGDTALGRYIQQQIDARRERLQQILDQQQQVQTGVTRHLFGDQPERQRRINQLRQQLANAWTEATTQTSTPEPEWMAEMREMSTPDVKPSGGTVTPINRLDPMIRHAAWRFGAAIGNMGGFTSRKPKTQDADIKRWGRFMGFEEVSKTMQQAFLDESSPAEKTNTILSNIKTQYFAPMKQDLATMARRLGRDIGAFGNYVGSRLTVAWEN